MGKEKVETTAYGKSFRKGPPPTPGGGYQGSFGVTKNSRNLTKNLIFFAPAARFWVPFSHYTMFFGVFRVSSIF